MPPVKINICICSFKRSDLLNKTLESLKRLNTDNLFTYSIVVADNDREESARSTVEAFSRGTDIEVTYCVEPEQNISLARNRALKHAKGEFVAWIDDDEFVTKDWLLLLFQTLHRYAADGVLGPVRPVFNGDIPTWIRRGSFFEKPRRKTGLILQWHQTSTANVLIRRSAIDGIGDPFRREFGSGCEDIDFFRRSIANGRTFVWCDEAMVSEIIPPTRWKRRYLLRRALLRGRNGAAFADSRMILKSIIALPIYLFLLPFLLVLGQHHFVRYLMKAGDHTGRLFGILGIKFMGDKYLTG